MARLYGLNNCDSCRAARRWLEDRGKAVEFVDIRAHTPAERELARWADRVGWQKLLNRRSRIWRELPATEREGIDATRAFKLMVTHPTLIKRPVLVLDNKVHAGFSPEDYRRVFGD